MTEGRRQPDTRLDAYLDGGMTPDERAAYQREIESDETVHDQVELQQDIDKSLRRLFAPPSADRVTAGIAEVRQSKSHKLPTPATKRGGGAVPRRLAAAAAIVAGIFGGWLIWNAVGPTGSGGYGEWRSFEIVYADSVANDMEPEWTCDTESEFADSIRSHFGQAAVIPFELPDGIAALGLAYCNSISRRTVYLLAEVNDEPVVVFIDRVEADPGQTVDETSGLNLFNRRLGLLVLYELSPLEKPALLQLFYDPDTDRVSPNGPP
ncbi:MAG: hypothetical protein IIB99_11815 [Planctomycetes bacterium]|nr:hypothetical protein [Planctomycetota bacterium]